MLSEYNSMYGDTLIMHGVVHMEDDIHRKQNDLILKLYTTPMEDLLVTCCDGLRGIIPFDLHIQRLTTNPIRINLLSTIEARIPTTNLRRYMRITITLLTICRGFTINAYPGRFAQRI